jgi:DNA mismatch endonuclease (patch repair protein)
MDKLSAERRSANMARIRSKDTKPEVLLRRLLHAEGYRFRLHRKDLPGKPDLVFPSRKKAIFVHGCFWHQHPGCREGRVPGSRREYWEPKLARNQQRDTAALIALKALGWDVLTVWECELNQIAAGITGKIFAFLDKSLFRS